MGRIIRATNKSKSMRLFAIDSTDMVEEARQIHNTTPVASAALGRTISAVSMMGVMLKGEKEKVTLQIRGDGELKGVVAVAKANGDTKAYPLNPIVNIPIRESDGKLDVGRAIGDGKLTVIKDFGLKEPYIGQTNLVSGEIAEDLTAYYAYSEQQPSVVALGVLVDTDYSIKASGGFIVQLMPDTPDEEIDILEQNLTQIRAVSDLICEEENLEKIIDKVFGELGTEILDEIQVSLKCDCSKEKMQRALISIGREEIEDILNNEKETSLQCHFCNTKYHFDEKELKELLEEISYVDGK